MLCLGFNKHVQVHAGLIGIGLLYWCIFVQVMPVHVITPSPSRWDRFPSCESIFTLSKVAEREVNRNANDLNRLLNIFCTLGRSINDY